MLRQPFTPAADAQRAPGFPAAGPDFAAMRPRIERELLDNILPFWMKHAMDPVSGGFYGALTNDLQPLNSVPRSAVLCARIIWTYSAAYRIFGQPVFLDTARQAYDYFQRTFWDDAYGGVVWMADRHGNPLDRNKQTYAQAFALYALAEYRRATGDSESLLLAQELFGLLEHHAADRVNGGYIEGCSQAWVPLKTSRLSPKEPASRKSMNTMLHMMEAYANLLRAWPDRTLAARLRSVIEIFLDQIIHPRSRHFRLFFNDQWKSLDHGVSYGHDIEGSWLLVEAAQVLGDQLLIDQAAAAAVAMAQAVFDEGLNPDGSLIYEKNAAGLVNLDKHWWAQAEAVVGFYNAYQHSGQPHFASAAAQCWAYIEDHFVDRTHGDWFKLLNQQGTPYFIYYKIGPWECPYHHSRACFEMLERLA